MRKNQRKRRTKARQNQQNLKFNEQEAQRQIQRTMGLLDHLIELQKLQIEALKPPYLQRGVHPN